MGDITKDHTSAGKQNRLGLIMAVYLLGLFIGALSTGIITPVRTIIQSSLGVDDQTGIWMITIFTLCYAAIIPVSGKLADRLGRKIIFIFSIALFGAGSVVCGLSASTGSFGLLLTGRVIQAVGAGGIMPIATAEFGTSFPPEKRGMALGLVGGVFGIANVLGATAGSAILDLFGTTEWQWVFYINVPICLLVIVSGLFVIPNHKAEEVYRIDKLGTLLMTIVILALLYGLKNINFFDFAASIAQPEAYAFLLLALVLIPIFVLVERRAEDPIFHIEYMKSSQIMLTLGMGLLVGASMMGMVFIPQFAENALRIETGSGGYFVLILGFFAGAASPVSGTLIDKFGAKIILGLGFVISILGALYLAFVATAYVNLLNVIISLVLIGLGLGLAMGTPLNYMMMRHTREEDSNSALATLSLVRSIGTAIAPAIMVGFLVQAGGALQTDLMNAMPELPQAPAMAQMAELEDILDELKDGSDEAAEMLADVDLDSMTDMSMDMDMTEMSGDMELPDDILDELKSSDVTTIVASSQHMAAYMFDEKTPEVITEIQGGIQEGIDGIGEGIDGVDEGIAEMSSGLKELDEGRAQLKTGINGISTGINGMETGLAKQDQAIAGIQMAIVAANSGQMPTAVMMEEEEIPGEETTDEPSPTPEPEPGTDPEPEPEPQPGPPMPDIQQLEQQLAQLEAARGQLAAQLATARQQRASMQSAYNQMTAGRNELSSAIGEAKEQRGLMVRAQELMAEMSNDIPTVFADMKAQYLTDIENNSAEIETLYQRTVNGGFRNMFICVAVINVLAMLMLLFYREPKRAE